MYRSLAYLGTRLETESEVRARPLENAIIPIYLIWSPDSVHRLRLRLSETILHTLEARTYYKVRRDHKVIK